MSPIDRMEERSGASGPRPEECVVTTVPGLPRICLTAKDLAALDQALAGVRWGPVRALLRDKLDRAEIVPAALLAANVVTLNSRVLYRIDDGEVEMRIVVRGEDFAVPGMTIPISTPRGLALVGLRSGDRVTIPRLDGGTERLAVVAVAYQPEAAWRAWQTQRSRDGAAGQAGGNVVRLARRRADAAVPRRHDGP